jgi:hypothetical protein
MLGTDFPYQQFFLENAKIVQIESRPSMGYARVDQEGRTLLHELFATEGDIRVSDKYRTSPPHVCDGLGPT